MRSLPFWFIALAVLFAVAGMGHGIYMGITEDHTMAPAHAHNNLIGWVTMALYGFYYKAVPSAAKTRLALVHFWLALAGSATIGVGIALAGQGVQGLVQVASLLVIGAMIVFAYIVWTNRAGLTVD
jgi:cbb3-type cytochrome oxidase subunit 1